MKEHQSKSFNEDLNFKEGGVATKVILETSFSREIRILLKEGQVMKEHMAPHPIVVHVIKGKIDFGIEGQSHVLDEGAIISLDGKVPHDLKAVKDSIVRLSLSKMDNPKRVEDLAKS